MACIVMACIVMACIVVAYVMTGFLTMFQCITMEGWTDVMYLLEDGYSKLAVRSYFTLLILFGGIFTINLGAITT